MGDLGSIPGSGRSLAEGNGNLIQCLCLENPLDRGAWQATVHGVARFGHNLGTECISALWFSPGHYILQITPDQSIEIALIVFVLNGCLILLSLNDCGLLNLSPIVCTCRLLSIFCKCKHCYNGSACPSACLLFWISLEGYFQNISLQVGWVDEKKANECMCVHMRSVMSDSLRLWIVAHQAPMSMRLSRHEFWSGLNFPP